MTTIKRLDPERCGLLVVDIQERMMRVIPAKDEVVRNSILLIKTAKELGMPIVATTQYVARIGELLPEITAEMPDVQAIDKLEEMLDGGMKKTHMFGPAEYVTIYTYV